MINQQLLSLVPAADGIDWINQFSTNKSVMSEPTQKIIANLQGMLHSDPELNLLRRIVIAPKRSLEECLFDFRAQSKRHTSAVSMYLGMDYRETLFRQIDEIADPEEWSVGDKLPSMLSFSSFLRLIITLKPDRKPGLGLASDGNIVAAWTAATDQLTIECRENDNLRYMLSVNDEGLSERLAGDTTIYRLMDRISSFKPARWFLRK